MQHDSLFGHLASRFSGQTENIATEALNYIINRSSVARRAFLQFAAQADVELPDTLRFQTQAVGDDNAIPDLVGMDSESRQVLLVEAKFWAGLTVISQLLTSSVCHHKLTVYFSLLLQLYASTRYGLSCCGVVRKGISQLDNLTTTSHRILEL